MRLIFKSFKRVFAKVKVLADPTKDRPGRRLFFTWKSKRKPTLVKDLDYIRIVTIGDTLYWETVRFIIYDYYLYPTIIAFIRPRRRV